MKHLLYLKCRPTMGYVKKWMKMLLDKLKSNQKSYASVSGRMFDLSVNLFNTYRVSVLCSCYRKDGVLILEILYYNREVTYRFK